MITINLRHCSKSSAETISTRWLAIVRIRATVLMAHMVATVHLLVAAIREAGHTSLPRPPATAPRPRL